MIALIDGDELRIDANGYIRNKKNNYIHREIVEKVLGKKLPDRAVIHHVDYNPKNNTNSNLVLCPNHEYHMILHKRTNVINNGGNPDIHAWCSGCKTIHLKEEFSTTKQNKYGLHPTCRKWTNEYRKEKDIGKGKFNWRERLNQQYRRAFSGCTKREITQL